MNTRFILLILLTFIIFSCKKSDFPGYDRAESGLYYRFFEKKNGKKPAVNDYVILRIAFKAGDSMLFSSSKILVPYRIQLPKPIFQGDFFEAIAMMGEGDSASFIINGDSLFLKALYSPAMRQGLDSTRNVFVDIRLVKVQTLAELDLERKSHGPRERELLDEMKSFEPVYIAEYIKKQKIKEKPTESGLYIIIYQPGKGETPQKGNRVTVRYSGRFLDGAYFDTNIEEIARKAGIYKPDKEYLPFEFEVGVGEVISGWEEGIMQMKKDGKYQLIIPSVLAYGEEGAGQVIPPYTPLLFEIEMINIK